MKERQEEERKEREEFGGKGEMWRRRGNEGATKFPRTPISTSE